MTRAFPLAPLVMAITLASGCANLAPDYQRPDSPVPGTWQQETGDAPADTAMPGDIGWRDFFGDARLQALIEQALANNRDLRVAALNIDRARALYRIQRADQLPSVDATAAVTAQRIAETLSDTGEAMTTREYSVNLGFASYELDFFGRVQNLKDQALQQFLATEEARRSTQISLVGEVANAYLNLVADRERLQLAERTLASQRESYELTRRSFDVGVASELDLYQARTSVDTARVDVAIYTAQVIQDRNALTLLVGTPLSETGDAATLSDVTATIGEPPAGLQAEVLLHRPDILAAEYELRAANANIGAARAAFFPSITLTASAGTASDSLSGLFESGSGTWSFAPRLNLPIFDAGRNRANLDVAKLDRDILVAQYEQAIQSAFREVADALAERNTLDERLDARRSLTEATESSYRLSDARYRRGIDSYLNVLDSQRALYSAQQALISTRLLQASNRVTLYRVLGGGSREDGIRDEHVAAAR